MLIQAIDGKFYKNPSIYGERCFLTYQDSPGATFTYALTDNSKSSKYVRMKGYDLLAKLAIKGVLGSSPYNIGQFSFPPDWKTGGRGVCWEITLRDKIPVPNNFIAVVDRPAAFDDFLAWDMDFTKDELDKLIKEKKPPELLVRFLLGKQLWALTPELMAGLIRRVRIKMRASDAMINNQIYRLKRKTTG